MKLVSKGPNHTTYEFGHLTVIALSDGYVDMPISRIRSSKGNVRDRKKAGFASKAYDPDRRGFSNHQTSSLQERIWISLESVALPDPTEGLISFIPSMAARGKIIIQWL